ncbi:McKusick-Kaufman/Bardet-Biedl syndromes putative chaperonin [Chionoecetes opilio]|uniref:McKusick-Kaufman/Bardet-Biedl syndromes putative chaperonin n=1 Tax=Chionoecetes opilio TaxID=41210 RepID=A0A8J8WCC5_CHIOP|nr:McKusick-Kaufman/Bardet-Biedl syndromes putative chaperonin [Chionoecetes opilio]
MGMGKARKFVHRNLVMIVMVPVLLGVHYGWQKVQDTEMFVPKQQRRDLPIVEMSGVVLEGERVKGVFCHSVTHPSYLSMLASYRKLLLSAYGPKGSSVLISNAVGREALVSSSSEIIKELSFAHPTTKYINALISAQNSSCGLNGLYTGLVCVRLLEEALRCEEDMLHPLVSCISEWIISQLMEQLNQFPAQVVMELDIGDMDQVVCFVKTIIGAKRCLGLTHSEANDLTINIVRAFLRSIPGEYMPGGFGHVSITAQEDGPSSPGGIFEGVLYRNPDVSLTKVEEVGARGEIWLLLFNVALSYTEETATVVWGGPGTKEESFGSLVLASLMSVLKKRNISIVANQKSVHPVIKFELERAGWLVLERLGTSATEALVRVSGCRAVGTLNNLPGELNDAVLGTLTSLQNVAFNNRDYILLDHSKGCVATLLLPSASPSILPTLKETVESCLAGLRMAVVDGKVVCGGGCLEAWAATTVTRLITTKAHLITAQPAASPHHVVKVGNIFVRMLMELALHLSGGSSNRFDWSVDTVFHHLWHTPPCLLKDGTAPGTGLPASPSQRCVCGLVTQEAVKYKYNGWWKPVEFQLSDHVPTFPPQHKEGGQKSGKCSRSTVHVHSSEQIESDAESLGHCTEDSLEGCANTSDEDVDSLEKTTCSLEEEIDSLEGKLESFDLEEYDSLEDLLERDAKPEDDGETGQVAEAKLEGHVPGALYDSLAAKMNATKLAFEGFSQLLHIGQCIFDK